MPHNRPDYPSLNSKPACIKVVDTFRAGFKVVWSGTAKLSSSSWMMEPIKPSV